MIKKLLVGILFILALSFSAVCSADVLITPDEGAGHPFVYLSEEFVSGLKDENGEVKPAYAKSYSNLLTLANRALPAQPEGGYLSANISQRLMARALMYALGEVDYAHARETIEYTLEYLKKPLSAKTGSIEMYKDIGEYAIQTGALVYDWCYDALEEEEKELLYKYVMEQYKDTNGDGSPNYDQPCRADNINTSAWTDVASKSVGQPLIYNAITATAFYDIDPEFYNIMMGRIQGTMADAVKAYGSVGALSDGSIQYGRFLYTYYTLVLFQRMGATEAQLLDLYGDQSAFGYKMLYSRMPWGATMRQGDGYTLANYSINHFTAGTEVNSIGILANVYGNPYFRQHYLKENYGGSSIYKFLTMDCETGVKLPDDLPLAFKTSSPRTEIMARTSWKDGINSPAVFAYMNMNERRTGDHDHADIGNFQLHYKGPLTMPSGVYAGADWGGNHWRNYYTRSVAANCVTVYMPGEVFKFGSKVAEANDGGQKMAGNKDGGYVIGQYAEHFADDNIWAVTEGAFIGPNEKTPAFSYLKGDITKAYSENKMESYKRSMVFMDTFNESYPGVMVVFDRVVSKDKTFDKKWLLQAVLGPQISGNKITITNTKDGANGKLVNTVLLPENAQITEVGGISKYVVNGVEYPADWEFEAAEAYKSGYRAEVSPSAENEEDIFLNAMFVTDADGNAPDLPMIKEENNLFLGVTTLDRTVFFSKNGEEVETSFEIDIRDNNSGNEMLCFIADLKSGKWKVSGSDVNIILETNEDENCIVFSVLPGEYSVAPAAENETVTNLLWEEAGKEKQGDFVIKKDTGYINIVDENILIDGVPYISAKTAENLGVQTIEDGTKLTILNGKNKACVNAGETKYSLLGCEMKMNNPAILRDGKIYIPVLQMQSALGITAEYVPEALLLKTISATKIDTENLLVPEKVEGVINAAMLADGNIGEEITFSDSVYPYRVTPVIYSFDSIKNISQIIIAGGENIRIYYSLDGEDYYLISDNEKTKENNVTTIKTDVCAKYIKFEAVKSSKISEVAVYGENINQKCAFASGNIESFLRKEPLIIQAYIEKGFESAGVYIGDTPVCDITEEADEVYDLTVSESILESISADSVILKIETNYAGVEYSAEQNIKLINCDDKINIINESFDGGSYNKVFGTRNGYKLSRNTQGFEESFENKRYTILFDKAITGSGAYISATGFKYGSGCFDICFDAEISSNNVLVAFELRNSDNKNVDNLTYPLVSGVMGDYSFIIRADTLNRILRVFAKNKETDADYCLLKEMAFPNNNLGQIRFNVSSRDESATVSFDNYYVDYYPLGISLFTPQNNQMIESDKVLLSASCPGADEVYFYINGEEVCKFNSPSNGLCEYEMLFETNGVKVFDIYSKKGNVVYTQSCTFAYGKSVVTDIKHDNISLKTDSGYVLNNTAEKIDVTLGLSDVIVKTVKMNGKEINFSSSFENNILTIEGLNLNTTGLLEVIIEGDEAESILLYVVNDRNLSVVSDMVLKSETDVFVFSKVKNFGNIPTNCTFAMAEYSEVNKLKQIKLSGKQILSDDEIILTEHFELQNNMSKYKAMIWDECLCNLTDVLD